MPSRQSRVVWRVENRLEVLCQRRFILSVFICGFSLLSGSGCLWLGCNFYTSDNGVMETIQADSFYQLF